MNDASHRMTRALGVALCIAAFSACAAASQPRAASPALSDAETYLAARQRLVADEHAMRLGAALVLSPDEQAADARLMKMKAAELSRTRQAFPPARSFLLDATKRAYEQSPLFQVLQRMPKGAVLHAHFSAMGDFRWIANHARASARSYVFMDEQPGTPRWSLRLADASPGQGWHRLAEVLAGAADPAAIDRELYAAITLGEEDASHPDIWDEFVAIFARTRGLFADRSFTADYFDHVVENLVSDNVQYLELRSNPVDEAWIERSRRHDQAFDVKFIPATGRSATRQQVAAFLDNSISQREARPERVKGFDLVQEEDEGNTNLFYVEELLAARAEARRRGTDLPFYLHSGETNWAENENLFDAVLLGAPRLGHALALFRHPLLLREVKARAIPIEVCPISNQILGYVSDIRTHPAAHYINADMAVVLSTDDPGIFRTTLSHDFFAAFMSWGLDLRTLKQLAMNSLLYSTMTEPERKQALQAWQQRWAAFITWVNVTYPPA